MKALGPTRVLRAAALFSAFIAASPIRAFEPIADTAGFGDLGARIIAAEGGPGRNPLSSAAGYGQFLSGTWLEMFERAYPQVAQTMTREQILALRDIKPLAEDLTNRYAQASAATLRSVGLPAAAGRARNSVRRRRLGFCLSGSSRSSCCAASPLPCEFSTEPLHAHCSMRSATCPTDRPSVSSRRSKYMPPCAASCRAG
jgi:hypothetical protein